MVLCIEVWPPYLHYRYQEVWFQYKIKEKLCSDLPAMLNGYQPPSELCSLTLPPLQEIDPIQNYRIIDSHPIYDSLESLQVLNSTMFARAILEMKDKTNFSSIGQTRDQTVSPSPYTKFTYQSVRHRRFVITLMSLAFEGFKTYISHKADEKFIKSMKIIRKNQKIMDKKNHHSGK